MSFCLNHGIYQMLSAYLETDAQRPGMSELQNGHVDPGPAFYYKNEWVKVRAFTVEDYGADFQET